MIRRIREWRIDRMTDRVARRPHGRYARRTYGAHDAHSFSWEPVLAALQLAPEDILLDVGCGGGGFLRRALETGCRAVGLDHSAAWCAWHGLRRRGWLEPGQNETWRSSVWYETARLLSSIPRRSSSPDSASVASASSSCALKVPRFGPANPHRPCRSPALTVNPRFLWRGLARALYDLAQVFSYVDWFPTPLLFAALALAVQRTRLVASWLGRAAAAIAVLALVAAPGRLLAEVRQRRRPDTGVDAVAGCADERN